MVYLCIHPFYLMVLLCGSFFAGVANSTTHHHMSQIRLQGKTKMPTHMETRSLSTHYLYNLSPKVKKKSKRLRTHWIQLSYINNEFANIGVYFTWIKQRQRQRIYPPVMKHCVPGETLLFPSGRHTVFIFELSFMDS